MTKPPESIHALKGQEVAVVAGGETLRGRLAAVQGECLILTSEDICGEKTTAVVRWPLVAAVVAKEEPEKAEAKAPLLRCNECGAPLHSWQEMKEHRRGPPCSAPGPAPYPQTTRPGRLCPVNSCESMCYGELDTCWWHRDQSTPKAAR
jgi:hypothetical protein